MKKAFFSHFIGAIVGSGLLGLVIKNVPIDDLSLIGRIVVCILFYITLIVISLIHAISHDDRK